jgi:myo-inositol 2-dehydrogenase/D-chiro-inositol 1-dehydrogenase
MMGVEHIENVNALPGARVVAVADPHPPSLDAARAAAAGTVTAYADHRALLDAGGCDAVVVATPNDTHVDVLEDVLAVPDLHVLVEKPLCTTVADCERVVAMAADRTGIVWVGLEYRYMPPVARLVEAVRHGAIGRTHMIAIREHRFPFLRKVGDWNRFRDHTGGTLVEKCCHFFDLMRLILRDEPVRVMASAGQAANHLDEVYDGAVPDVWDHGYVIVEFARGARAMLELCMFAEGGRYQEEIAAIGPVGKIEARVPGPGRFWPGRLGPAPLPRLIVSPREPKGPRVTELAVDPAALAAGDHNGATLVQHLRFNAVVRGQGQVEVTLADSAAAVRLGLAAQDSARRGEAVQLG